MDTIPPPSMQGQYAGFVTRLLAFVIDVLLIHLIVLVVTGVIALLIGFFENLMLFTGFMDAGLGALYADLVEVTAFITFAVMIWLYPALFWMIGGQTIGKRIMGLRVVRTDGSRMTFWRGLVRVFGYVLSALPLFLGFIWILFSNRRRGWHDILAGTCVIYAWEAQGSEALHNQLVRATSSLRNDTSEA